MHVFDMPYTAIKVIINNYAADEALPCKVQPCSCRLAFKHANAIHVCWLDHWRNSWLHHGISELCR